MEDSILKAIQSGDLDTLQKLFSAGVSVQPEDNAASIDIATSAKASSKSDLNPHAREFVPRFIESDLNPDAAEFCPSFPENDQPPSMPYVDGFPQYSEMELSSELQTLQDMFPSVQPDVVTNTWNARGWDFNATVDELLTLNNYEQSPAYFLFRSEYVFDYGSFPAYPGALAHERNTTSALENYEEAFPSLPTARNSSYHEQQSSLASGETKSPKYLVEEPSALVQKLRLEKLQILFPWVSGTDISTLFRKNRCSLERTTEELRRTKPPPPDWSQPLKPRTQAPHRSLDNNKDSPVVPRWVETGENVSTLYAELREEARMLALARNQCFMNATKAFVSGNKALAKELGREGRAYNSRMKELHQHAAAQIFARRNREVALSGLDGGGRGQPLVLDLHGLHAQEAVAVVDATITHMAANAGGTLQLITGTGHHSSSRAALRPAIERLLSSWDPPLHYSLLPDKKNYVGCLQVSVPAFS